MLQLKNRLLPWLALAMLTASAAQAQDAFLNFNTVGQYTNNFNVWEDINGVDGTQPTFEENLTDGVGGSGGVSVFGNSDTTAVYKSASWNMALDGATMVVSILIQANGQTSANKIQLGIMNEPTNGLNSNPGVEFESFRFIPISATSWGLYEQYRIGNITTSPATLGTVAVVPGRWYDFIVGVTNISETTGTYAAGCALYDYGTDGLTPGTNVVTFAAATNHPGPSVATNSAVWPAFRTFQNAGIDAWDNFLVYTAGSAPQFTLGLSNVSVSVSNSASFRVLAAGPGPIAYDWYTNGVLAAGVTGPGYTTPLLPAGFTNVTVVALNPNGSATNSATVNVTTNMLPIALSGFNRDLVIESNAVGPPYANDAAEFNPGENTAFYQQGLPGTSYGLPSSNVFSSVIDGTIFQFQPYTASNALVMSSDTGITAGTLALAAPATYMSLAILANSGNAQPTSAGVVTLQFADGTSYSTSYDGADWFFNPGFALQGVDRINLTSGATDGGPTDPRFYQTTLNLSQLLGATNKPIIGLTFTQASGAASTAIYAVSGRAAPATNAPFAVATLANLPASALSSTSATLNGEVLSNGGYAPVVTVFYGPADGGTNAANWANSNTLGVVTGAYSLGVQGLSAGTAYYYTAMASSYAGVSWATPSERFGTTGVSAPRVANAPATGIAATYATLNGNVITTGGTSAGVTLYYGMTDGSTNAANWSGSIFLGAQSNSFAQTVSGLAPNTAYFFTAEISNGAGVAWAAPSLSFTTAATNPVATELPMLTYHNDNTRQGVNTNETQLTLANVNTNSFGKLFSYPVDGFIYAQPLVMTNVAILGRGTHDVVFVATEHDSVYAFDADSDQGLNAAPLWQVSFINPAAGITTVPTNDVGTRDIFPEIGITSTPVIDPATGTLYVEVKTKEVANGTTSYVHRLHALDITTGQERVSGAVSNSPIVINVTNYPGTGTSGYSDNDGQGHVVFNGLREMNRCALTLVNGMVLLGYASHGDNQPYHGWLFAYDAHSLAPRGVYNSTPNGGLGGFWQGGGSATIDANTNLYWVTGNGSFSATGGSLNPTNSYAMSVLKFVLTNNGIVLTDFFTPFNESSLSSDDEDLGSGAALALPDSAGSAAYPHLLVAAGKGGKIYLIDRDNMGKYNSANDYRIVQVLTNAIGSSGQNGSYMTPCFFNNTLYYVGMNGYLEAFSVSNGQISPTPVEASTLFGDKGSSSPTISANGTNNAIVWVTESDAYASVGPAILHAYKATNVSQEIYNTSQNFNQDNPGGAVKFTVPTVVNGKVYMGTAYALSVYGNATFVNSPVISPNGAAFVSSISITLSDSTPNATIYYTTDGTTPTTASQLYTAPFLLTNSAEIQAIAVKPGAVNSGVVAAGFVDTSSVGSGTGLLGSYWSDLSSAVFTNTNFNVPPTLTRTDAVVNFNWTNTSPDPSISPTNFVVQWSGSVQPQFNETYTFTTFTDAGVMLWVNGQLLINKWVNQGPTAWSGSIALTAQQRYNIVMYYFYTNQGGAVAQLSWSSPSTPAQVIPQSQLYPQTNPPPMVVLTSPTNGYVGTAVATITAAANAATLYNPLAEVAFYLNGSEAGAVTNAPYELTIPGLAAGSYTLTAVAIDGSGLAATSAPVSFTIGNGTGAPYGLSSVATNPAYFNMPPSFDGSSFGTIPATLSQTGVFVDTPGMTPYGGLIPYAPIVPLWSDNALKTRYFAIPNGGAPLTAASQIGYAPTGQWSFPAGTVFVKTFELLTNESDTNSIRRLETRLLVRDEGGSVYGVTYKWRPDNSDADLLTTSSNEPIAIVTPGGVVTQTWYYPSPSDCLQCHTPQANYVLGVNARQLNTTYTYPSGVSDNELRTINRLGLLNPAIDESAIPGIEQLYSLTNSSASYQMRARSYLDANCAQCHVPGGTGPTFDARFDTPLTNQNMINVPAVKGDLGYADAMIIAPQDPLRSVIYDRMNTVDPSIAMPPLARNLIDSNAVAVMAAWINSLPATNLVFSSPTILPGGAGVQLQFLGAVSQTYILQASTNLLNWMPISTSTPTASPFYWIDPAATNIPARFYRAVQTP